MQVGPAYTLKDNSSKMLQTSPVSHFEVYWQIILAIFHIRHQNEENSLAHISCPLQQKMLEVSIRNYQGKSMQHMNFRLQGCEFLFHTCICLYIWNGCSSGDREGATVYMPEQHNEPKVALWCVHQSQCRQETLENRACMNW